MERNFAECSEANHGIEVRTRSFFCDAGALGHPRVYLRIGAGNEIKCPYCGQGFFYKDQSTHFEKQKKLKQGAEYELNQL